MARALENLEPQPRYLDFFGMVRAPFARLSQPTQVFHAEQYSQLNTHLAAATEHADRLLVLGGANGSGKTTLLNRYIASLNGEVSFATIDETCADATQFYCELLRQLGFSDISGKLNELRHISREFLLHRGLAHDPVLIIIDNAHLVCPAVLEQLRWLSEIATNDGRVVSLVLSGNSDLTRIMSSPAMSLVKFKDLINFTIRVFTEQETDDYVRHRLRLAGGSESAKFTAEARPLVHRFSGGNPSLINTFCNAVLTEAFEQRTRVISEALVRKVADDGKFIPHVLPAQTTGRRKTDSRFRSVAANSDTEERINTREAPPKSKLADFAAKYEDERNTDALLAQVSALSEELEVTRDSAAKALLDIDARDADINALLDKVAQQSKDLEQAEKTTRDNNAEIDGLRQALRDSEAEVENLNQALGDSSAEIRSLNEAARESNAELGSLEQALADSSTEIKSLKEATRDSGAEIENLNQALADSSAEIKSLKEAARDSGAEIERLNQTLSESNAEIESLSQTAQDGEVEIDDLNQALRDKAGEIERFSLAARDSEAEIESLSQALRDSATEIESLSQALGDRSAAIEELERASRDRNADADGLHKALEEKSKEIEDLHKALQGGGAEIEGLSKTLREREQKSDELNQDLKTARNTARKTETELTKATRKLEKLEVRKTDLQNSLRDLKAQQKKDAAGALRDKKAYDKRIKELEKSVTALEKQQESLRARAEDADRLEDELASRDVFVKELQAELDSYVEELTATQVQLGDDPSGTTMTPALKDDDAYRGEISTIEVFKDGILDRFLIVDPGQRRLMIGRGDDSEVCLNSKFVSRHHALMFFGKQRAYIEDLRSYNGTMVNGKKISRCDLKVDDTITMGDFELRPRKS